MVMKSLLGTLALVTLASLAWAQGEEPPSDDPMVHAGDVLVLTSSNFTETVKPEKLMLVEFYAPWCGHCKALAPEYAKAATELKNDDIKLAKVDCTAETELCNEHGVQGYPTMKVFRENKAGEYGGGREKDSIVSYMRKQSLPAVTPVNVDNFEEFQKKDNVVIIGFFNEGSQSEFNTFNDLAAKLRDEYVFGATGQAETIEKAKVTPPTVILYKKFDEGMNVLGGSFDENKLEDFIKVNARPLMGEIGPENYASYVDSGIPLAYLFYENDEQRETMGKTIEPVAREFKGKLNFVYISATKFGSHAENINLKQQWPAFGIQKPQEGYKYPFDQSHKITEEAIREFVTKFDKGEIQPSVKSQPIPEKNDEPVVVVVGDSFEDIVYDKEKDVLVEFYAPWCGHCKKLAPIYEKLGEKYAAFKDKILIAKMDSTENDLPARVPFRVDGFPTIKLFKAGEKEVVDYAGDRSLESFVEFLDKNAANKIDIDAAAKTAEGKVPKDSKTSEESPKQEQQKPHDEL